MVASSIKIDPKAVQNNASKPLEVSKAKAAVSSFDSMMGAVGAMGPFAQELSYGMSGDPTATSVIAAAFSSFPAAASSLSGGAAAVGYPSYAGVGGYTQSDSQVPGISGAGVYGSQSYIGGNSQIGGTSVTTYGLMQTMNQNNLQMLELQAVMQSNQQQWTTKSNILASDHRAKMSMIEKFTARG